MDRLAKLKMAVIGMIVTIFLVAVLLAALRTIERAEGRGSPEHEDHARAVLSAAAEAEPPLTAPVAGRRRAAACVC